MKDSFFLFLRCIHYAPTISIDIFPGKPQRASIQWHPAKPDSPPGNNRQLDGLNGAYPQVQVTLVIGGGLYPLRPFTLTIFSWRAIASQQIMLMSGFAGHIDSWLAIARQEKIDKLEKLNGYNFLTVTQSCEWGIVSRLCMLFLLF